MQERQKEEKGKTQVTPLETKAVKLAGAEQWSVLYGNYPQVKHGPATKD